MKVPLVLIVGTVFSCTLSAHGVGQGAGCDYDVLVAKWNVFHPDGEPPNDQIEDGARLVVKRDNQTGNMTARFNSFDWRVAGNVEPQCPKDNNPLLRVPINNGKVDKVLCAQRVTNILALMKRDNQKYPQIRQLGLQIVDPTQDCDEGSFITPGHSHADD